MNSFTGECPPPPSPTTCRRCPLLKSSNPVAQEEDEMAETGPEALARMIVAKGLIILVPSTQSLAAHHYPVANGDVLLLCNGQRPEVFTDWQLYWPLAGVWTKRFDHMCATKEHVQMPTKSQEGLSTVDQWVKKLWAISSDGVARAKARISLEGRVAILHLHDFITLKPIEWLSGQIFDFYIQLKRMTLKWRVMFLLWIILWQGISCMG
ncbi:unnamed protein product [Coregonus sp. 'balchen']|nr:unnamed protein product [Coregonus sp. 'balchen']